MLHVECTYRSLITRFPKLWFMEHLFFKVLWEKRFLWSNTFRKLSIVQPHFCNFTVYMFNLWEVCRHFHFQHMSDFVDLVQKEGFYRGQKVVENRRALDWCGSVGWTPSCKPKGCWLDSWSGYMPRLWTRFQVGGMNKATHQCFSPSLSPYFPLCLKKKKKSGETWEVS